MDQLNQRIQRLHQRGTTGNQGQYLLLAADKILNGFEVRDVIEHTHPADQLVFSIA